MAEEEEKVAKRWEKKGWNGGKGVSWDGEDEGKKKVVMRVNEKRNEGKRRKDGRSQLKKRRSRSD